MGIIEFRDELLKDLVIIKPGSHKGENGRVLVIGGSDLFHSASLWAAELLAHFVDLVFYYSPALINREILLSTKSRFQNGIVISPDNLADYLAEAEVILLGPGMERNSFTRDFANNLLKNYRNKKWVVDAGALQELDLHNCQASFIYTPHQGELARLFPHLSIDSELKQKDPFSSVAAYPGTWLVKNKGVDYVFSQARQAIWQVRGGNEGLIKGGTGDLLSSLVAAFYVKNEAVLAAGAASALLKKSAETLYLKQGPYFSTSELLAVIPSVFWQLTKNQRLD
jgi:NAD(P)H-hydrate epimerase